MDSRPWTDTNAALGLSKEIDRTSLVGPGRALAVTGEEPSLSATVAAAVRVSWQEIAAQQRPHRYPVWWTAPTGLRLDHVARALAEHLGSPVGRGENASRWVSRVLVEQRVPALILSDLGNLPMARREWNSLPRLLAYLVKSTSALFVFVDPNAEQVLFDVPAGIELASRTVLITIPGPELGQVLPFRGDR